MTPWARISGGVPGAAGARDLESPEVRALSNRVLLWTIKAVVIAAAEVRESDLVAAVKKAGCGKIITQLDA